MKPDFLPVHLITYGYENTVIDSQVVVPACHLRDEGISPVLVFFESFSAWIGRSWTVRRKTLAAKGLRSFFLPRAPRNFGGLNTLQLYALLRKISPRGLRIVIHARGLQSANVALDLKKLLPNVRVLCDIRGIESEEYAFEVRSKKKRELNALERKWRRRLELLSQRAVDEADGVTAVSRTISTYFKRDGARWDHIPCAVDVETFAREIPSRDRRRSELGVKGRLVVAYSGALSPWQGVGRIPAFLSRLREVEPTTFFLGLTPQPEAFEKFLIENGHAAADFRVIRATHNDMPGLLAAADVGILLREPSIVNKYACPTKFAEYLAGGLHVVATDAVDEIAFLLKRSGIGTLLSAFDPFGEHALSKLTEIINASKASAARTTGSVAVARRALDWSVYVPVLKRRYLELAGMK